MLEGANVWSVHNKEACMVLRIVRFIGLLFMALALGVGFSALIGAGARNDFYGTVFLTVQEAMYQDIGRLQGFVEPIAFIAVLLALLRVRRRKPFFIMTLVSCICIAAMIGMRVFFIQPIHQAITSWGPENIPDIWMIARNRYYQFTAISAGFSIIGFCSFSLSVLFDTPQYRAIKKVSN
jgi:uncharacterized membrane protein YczE